MTVTLNANWERVELAEAQAGRKIGRGNDDDLQDLNRAIIHEFAADVATALAILNVPVGITAYTTVFAVVARAKVRVWGNGDRVAISMYGNQTRVRLTVGGVVLGSATVLGAGNAWGTSATFTLAGAVRDSNGMVIISMEVQRTTGAPVGTPTLFHAIMFEAKLLLANLPAAGNTQTQFRAMHDELYATADEAVDNFGLQKLDDNAEFAIFERPRRACHLFPLLGGVHQFHRMSSCQWRLDGPYCIQVPPYASEGLTVTVTWEVSAAPAGLGQEVFALSEYEDFDEERVARAVLLASGSVNYLTFQGVAARAGQVCLVWVAFRSVVSGSTTTSPDAYGWSNLTPQNIWCERDATVEGAGVSPGGIPWGYCIVSKAEDIAASKDPTIKNALGYSTQSQVVDIATMQGIDNSAGGGASPALMLCVSPHPGTGITRGPDWGPRVQHWAGGFGAPNTYTPTLDIRRCAIGFLYAVYIQCGPVVAPARRMLARAKNPPTASLIESIGNRVNQLVYQGTAQCLLRHSGQRNIKPTATLGAGQIISYEGSYLFLEGNGVGSPTYPWTVPLIQPNVSGGLASLTLYAQFIIMASIGDGAGYPDETEIIYRCRFTTGDWVTGTAPIARVPSGGAQQSPTEADTLAAMVATSNEVGSVPIQSTGNAYGQCFTWPTEGNFKAAIWQRGVVFKDISQPAFPAILTAEIQALGGAKKPSNARVIVAGLHVWWGPREE